MFFMYYFCFPLVDIARLSRRARENAWLRQQLKKRPLHRQNPKDAATIDLATSENWLVRPQMLTLLKSNVQKNLKEKHLSMSGLGGTPELLTAMSTFFNNFFSPTIPVKPEHIVTGPGHQAVLDTLINDICDEGDGLLVATPMSDISGISSVLRKGVKLVPVHIPFEKSNSAEEVVDAYRAAADNASCNIRGIVVSNPQNPFGHICPIEVTEALLKYCEETDIHYVSDEVHALSTFGTTRPNAVEATDVFESPSNKFTSVLSRNLRWLKVNGSRVHVVYSIGKDFGCSGLTLGCVITQTNKKLRMSQAILNNAKVCSTSALMVAPLLQDTEKLESLVNFNLRRVRQAAEIATQFAEFHDLEFYKPVSGIHMWLRLSEECDTEDEEEDLVQRCAQQGVLVGSGSDYAGMEAGWFRLTFALPEQELVEGLRRLEAAVGYKEQFEYISPRESRLRNRCSKLLSKCYT